MLVGYRVNVSGLEARTSISRKFSGGPYSSSKDCDRASGSDCILDGLSVVWNWVAGLAQVDEVEGGVFVLRELLAR